MSAASPTLHLRELLTIFYKYRAKMISVFLLVFALFFAVSFIPTPRYSADAVLTVKMGAEYIYQPENWNNRTNVESTVPFNPSQIFKPEIALLENTDLHVAVINEITIEKLFPELVEESIFSFLNPVLDFFNDPQSEAEKKRVLLAKAVEKFFKRLDIETQKESSVITVSFQHKHADMAKQVMDSLLNHYFQLRKQIYNESHLILAEKEMQNSKTAYEQAQSSLSRFKLDNHVYDIATQRTLLLTNKTDLMKEGLVLHNAGMEKLMGSYDTQLAKLDTLEQQLVIKEKEVQVTQDAFILYTQKYNEARSFDALQQERLGSVRTVQQPFVSAEPRKWQWLILLAGAMVAGFCSLLYGYFIQFVHGRSFHNLGQIAALGLKPLAAIPYYKHLEEIDISVLLHQINPALRIIHFMSARSGEGKSFLAEHYAKALVKAASRRVLLIKINHQVEYGLVEQFLDDKDFTDIIEEVMPNYYQAALYGSEKPPAFYDTLANPDFWEPLAASFDTIILDGEAISHSFDSMALARQAEVNILVIQAEKTPVESIKSLCDIVRSTNLGIDGVILNRQRHHIPQSIYKKL